MSLDVACPSEKVARWLNKACDAHRQGHNPVEVAVQCEAAICAKNIQAACSGENNALAALQAVSRLAAIPCWPLLANRSSLLDLRDMREGFMSAVYRQGLHGLGIDLPEQNWNPRYIVVAAIGPERFTIGTNSRGLLYYIACCMKDGLQNVRARAVADVVSSACGQPNGHGVAVMYVSFPAMRPMADFAFEIHAALRQPLHRLRDGGSSLLSYNSTWERARPTRKLDAQILSESPLGRVLETEFPAFAIDEPEGGNAASLSVTTGLCPRCKQTTALFGSFKQQRDEAVAESRRVAKDACLLSSEFRCTEQELADAKRRSTAQELCNDEAASKKRMGAAALFERRLAEARKGQSAAERRASDQEARRQRAEASLAAQEAATEELRCKVEELLADSKRECRERCEQQATIEQLLQQLEDRASQSTGSQTDLLEPGGTASLCVQSGCAAQTQTDELPACDSPPDTCSIAVQAPPDAPCAAPACSIACNKDASSGEVTAESDSEVHLAAKHFQEQKQLQAARAEVERLRSHGSSERSCAIEVNVVALSPAAGSVAKPVPTVVGEAASLDAGAQASRLAVAAAVPVATPDAPLSKNAAPAATNRKSICNSDRGGYGSNEYGASVDVYYHRQTAARYPDTNGSYCAEQMLSPPPHVGAYAPVGNWYGPADCLQRSAPFVYSPPPPPYYHNLQSVGSHAEATKWTVDVVSQHLWDLHHRYCAGPF